MIISLAYHKPTSVMLAKKGKKRRRYIALRIEYIGLRKLGSHDSCVRNPQPSPKQYSDMISAVKQLYASRKSTGSFLPDSANSLSQRRWANRSMCCSSSAICALLKSLAIALRRMRWRSWSIVLKPEPKALSSMSLRFTSYDCPTGDGEESYVKPAILCADLSRFRLIAVGDISLTKCMSLTWTSSGLILTTGPGFNISRRLALFNHVCGGWEGQYRKPHASFYLMSIPPKQHDIMPELGEIRCSC